MILPLNINLLRTILLGGLLLMAALPTSRADAETPNIYTTRVTLLPSQITLSYSQDVRFSQVLSDAYAQSNGEIYALGTGLIDPHKQTIIDTQKRVIMRQLKQLNTPEATNMAKQLDSLPLVYHEQIATDLTKVRISSKFNPLIKQDYWLSLPKRPTHIKAFDPTLDHSVTMALQENADLRDYLAKLSQMTKQDRYDSAWIIQADRAVYQVDNLSWKNTLYFLSPGAIVFVGLQNLPDDYRDLNANIAHLLAFRLEL
ncbi:capsule biosynthesis GfcC family protein [Marinomonas sp. FW-1]|uniref:capsule biosynthesis GfcC family protein n=1 Tax=Marinomonas sp. FW-1 TaxID=2071621 RepID=UPI0010C12059|nr:capsule biosynthesis GfcC family protein [Marinomonas sp. FW-1]